MKNKDYYLGLNYPIVIEKSQEEDAPLFTASIKELPGLIVYSNSLKDIYSELEAAKEDWIDANLEWGRPINEPHANS